MDAATVEAMVRAKLPDCEIFVQGEGNHYEVTAVGEVFADMRPVKKQQLVYAALAEPIADGSIHAVNIRTFTPGEWQAAGGA
jgi:acid stress-induced BolA-like protein IbaG/YrbA